MPTLQPPGSELKAPPSQPATDAEPSEPKPPTLNGLPLAFSSGGSDRPSFSPFGATHCDLPLMEITDISLREASLFQTTSRRRLGSLGNRMEALILEPSGPSTSPNTTLRESYLIASLRCVESLANTPPQVSTVPPAAAGFGAGLGCTGASPSGAMSALAGAGFFFGAA